MRHKWAATLAAVATVGLVVTGCGKAASSGSTAAAAGSKKVTLIEGGGLDFSDAAIYQAMTLLKEQGYTVTLDNVADSTTALRAVLAGKADIYLGDPVEAATAVSNSKAAITYIGTDEQASDYEVLSLPEYTLKNLSGATMASAGSGTAGEIVGDAALKKLGVNTTALHMVTVGGTSARVTAILSGQVDLSPVHATDAASAVATGKVKVLLNAGAVLGTYLQQGLIASNSFLSDKTAAQATVNAFINASRWAAANESAYISVAQANKLTPGLTNAEAEASWKAFKADNFWAVNGGMCTSAISTTLTYDYQEAGGLTKATTPTLSSWTDATYVNSYLKAHGQSAAAC